MSRRLQATIGVLLAALFVWLFLRQADFTAVGAALRQADLWLIGAAVVTVLLTSLQRAWRWHFLLAPIARVRTWPLLECTLIGWTVSVLLPGRLGEIVRPVLLSRRADVKASAAIGTVVLERIFDSLTVLVLLAFYLTFLPVPPVVDPDGATVLDAMRTAGIGTLVVLVVLGVLTIFAMRSERALAALERLLRRWLPERLAGLAISFLEGMYGLRSPLLLVMISLTSLLLWLTILGTYVLLFHAFGIDLPWYASIPLLALLVLGVIVPTPGAVGSFHKAAQVGLVSLFAVDNDLAIAYAIVSHAVGFLPLALLGLLLLLSEGLSLASLERMGESGVARGPGSG